MNIVLCDKQFNAIALLNNYKSVIWNTKFYDVGDFEIYLPVIDNDILEKANLFEYIYINDKDNLRIITSIKISYTTDDGYILIISGHTLNYLLKNRIVWNQTNFSNADGATIISDLVYNNCVVGYCDSKRELLDGTYISGYLGENISAQYYGETLFDVVKGLCEQYKYGFYINIRYDNKFYFSIKNMTDRTKGTEYWMYYPPIVFDTRINNVLNFDIDFEGENYKNVELILGEGDGVSRLRKTVNDSTYTKLNRFEVYVNAQDLSQNNNTSQVITQSEYEKILEQRGLKKLESYKINKTLECTVDTTFYKYKADYNEGDICTVITPFMEQNFLITEVTECWNENGYSVTLTLDPNYNVEGDE